MGHRTPLKALVTIVFILAVSLNCSVRTSGAGVITEFAIPYPDQPRLPMAGHGSTHEITYNEQGDDGLWITGQNHDTVVNVGLDGRMSFYPMPAGSGPHGIVFDADGHLWVSLEFMGKIVRLDSAGRIAAEYDVRLDCSTCLHKINPHPHGLGVGHDGKTIWYTGKATGTIGTIAPNGTVQTFSLPTVGSVPIYIKAGPDGNMWVTELVGNAIARVTPDGAITEFPIPTHNSRPIAIVPEPHGTAMWFTEEAGNKVGRIDMDGTITEYLVPMTQKNVILAGLAFDHENNLWVQQYVDQDNALPGGPDHIIKIDKSILTTATASTLTAPITFYEVPTRATVMHRIIQGPDGNIWFTELNAEKVGKLTIPVTSP